MSSSLAVSFRFSVRLPLCLLSWRQSQGELLRFPFLHFADRAGGQQISLHEWLFLFLSSSLYSSPSSSLYLCG